MIFRFAFLLAAVIPLAAGPLRAETAEQWIAKARAYLGSESALNAVTSVHYSGTLETTEKVPSAEDKGRLVAQAVRLPAEIIVQKPYQQKFTLTRPDSIETRALDGYDGWSKTASLKTKQWKLSLLPAPQIKHLRAETWENLNCYGGLEKKGGEVRLGGDVTVDGVACVKLLFIHAEDIVFQRYFDKATGRLVMTETESGGEIREEGELIVNGVRFPKKVINKSANKEVTIITFDKVVLNEVIPASEFAVPALQSN